MFDWQRTIANEDDTVVLHPLLVLLTYVLHQCLALALRHEESKASPSRDSAAMEAAIAEDDEGREDGFAEDEGAKSEHSNVLE